MKKVTRYQTLDGQLFTLPEAAKAHADREYGTALCRLARRVVKVGEKYRDTTEFINDNLDDFFWLSRLKADIEIPEEEKDDEQ